METREVKTSVGTFVLRKPFAGVRNRALIKAETKDGFKVFVYISELLPKCIAKRPIEFDETVPIEQQLDSLSTNDYDLLSKVMNEMLEAEEENSDEKKTQSVTL